MSGTPSPRSASQASAFSDLALVAYEDLRSLAQAYLRNEGSGHTLQPTAVVHEAYIRLSGTTRMAWKGRTHFFAMAAIEMRRVLVDHARKAHADKRGGRRLRVELSEDQAVVPEPCIDLLALDQALTRLEALHPRQARVGELRLFAGLTIEELSELLGIAVRTVNEDWRVARAWIAAALEDGTSGG